MNDVLCNTKYLQLKSTQCQAGGNWVYAHRPNAENVVVILPHTENEILFLIEKRPPIIAENIGTYCIALPAGLVGDERKGESTEEAIKAELLEEAGLVAEKIDIAAQKVASSAGCTSEVCTIAIAKIRDKKPIQQPINDGGVIADRIWVNKKQVKDWLKRMEEKGYILTGQTLAALFYL